MRPTSADREVALETAAGSATPTAAAPEAFRVVADAEEHLRAGMLSQRGILKAFERMQQLDAQSVLDAVAELESMDPGRPNYGLLMLAVMGRWAELDGAAAMRYAEERLEGDLRSGVLANVVSSWSESDPAAALEWFRDSEESGDLAAMLGGGASGLLAPIFQGLANKDPEAALAALGEVATDAEYRSALTGMVSAMAAAGRSEQLLAHVRRLPEDRRGNARLAVVEQWAQFDPVDAARWIARQTDSNERATMAKRTALAWVRRDPQAALPWLFAHTPERQHSENLSEAIAIWARADPNAAATWLGHDAPETVDTDAAVAALSRQIIHRDPVSALAWASSMRNPAMREQTLGSVFAQWSIREPGVAREYLANAELAPELAERLRAMLPDTEL